ncbi:MAG: nicotinate (nicotinamide) nucleotide adenylyltransferase, partial [Ignavibacteriaceae bacterium]
EIPYFDVSDIELKNEKISYTIDTLQKLKKSYEHIELIIGYDNFLLFDKWKNPEKIIDLSTVIVLNRKTLVTRDTYYKFYNKAVMVETPLIEISGTKIRERVNKNLPIDFLVPQKVKEYIYNQNLYKE